MKLSTTIIILAAGRGKRMKSDIPKVLHNLNGMPMIHYIIQTAVKISGENIIVVTGYKSNMVKEALTDDFKGSFAYQDEQRGTGHAVKCALPYLSKKTNYVVPLCGDVPLLKSETVEKLIDEHISKKAVVTVLTTRMPDPTGYGRIIINHEGDLSEIIEETDASTEQKKINIVNTGIYCIDREFLENALEKIMPINKQGEYYLTDIIKIGHSENKRIAMMSCDDAYEVSGINTLIELEEIQSYVKANQAKYLDFSGSYIL